MAKLHILDMDDESKNLHESMNFATSSLEIVISKWRTLPLGVHKYCLSLNYLGGNVFL